MVERARLESVCTLIAYRGFESPSLRHRSAAAHGQIPVNNGFMSVVWNGDAGFAESIVFRKPDTAPGFCRSMDIRTAISFCLSPESPVLKVVTPGIALDTHRFDLK